MSNYVHVCGFAQEKEELKQIVASITEKSLFIPNQKQLNVLNAIVKANYDKYFKQGNALIMLCLEQTEGRLYLFPMSSSEKVKKLANCTCIDDILSLEVTDRCYQAEIPGLSELIEATNIVYSYYEKEIKSK